MNSLNGSTTAARRVLGALPATAGSATSIDISAPGIRETIIFAVFILVLLLRPQGLLGKAELRRHPELRFQDRDATRRACAKFALVPTSVMNFAEGTRFTLGNAGSRYQERYWHDAEFETVEQLRADGFALLKGRKVGLITNHTGVDRTGRRNVDVMRAAGVNIVALFSTAQHWGCYPLARDI